MYTRSSLQVTLQRLDDDSQGTSGCIFPVSRLVSPAAASAVFHCCGTTALWPRAQLVSISSPPSSPLSLGDSSPSFPRKPPPSALSSPSMSGKSISTPRAGQPPSSCIPSQPPLQFPLQAQGAITASPTLASSAGRDWGAGPPQGAPSFPLRLGRGQRSTGPGSGD